MTEKNLYDLLIKAPVGFAILRGPEFCVELVNNSMLKIWQKNPNDVLKKPLFDAIPEISDLEIANLLKRVYTQGKGYVFDQATATMLYSDSPETIYLKLVCEPLREEDNSISGVIIFAHDITEEIITRKRVEEKEKQFSDMVMQSPVAMIITKGKDHLIEIANKAMLGKIWKRNADEVIGKKIQEAFPELATQKYSALLNKVFLKGDIHSESEAFVMISSGDMLQKKYVDFEFSPVHDGDNNIYGILVTASDVTERVEARQKIEDAELRLRLAIDAAEMGTFNWDLNTQEFEFSERLAQIFGFKERSSITHLDLIKTLHPDDKDIRDRAVKESFEKGSLNYQARLIMPDRTIHWVSVYGKTVFNSRNEPIKMYGTATDITEQKLAQENMEDSEERLLLAIESARLGTWQLIPQKSELIISDRTRELFGLLNNTPFTLDMAINAMHKRDQERVRQAISNAVIPGQSSSYDEEYTIIGIDDGIERIVRATGKAFFDPEGKVSQLTGTIFDMTEQRMTINELEKRVEQRTSELKHTNEELVRINQELEQFAYVSSHDLQEPLRKIQTFSDILLKKIQPGTDPQVYLEKINASANRMSILINDLLNYSRLNKADEKFVAIDLNKVLDNVINDFEVLIKQTNAVVNTSILPIMPGIPIQINQLFYNLLSNSLKFSTTKPVINISAKEILMNETDQNSGLPITRRFVQIVFEDNGIGFESEYASQIFVIFQRLNDRKNYSGTGIGLAVCKKIVENHGGTITASGKLNVGAKFLITLPMNPIVKM